MEPAYLETCPCLAHNRMGLDSFNQPRNGVKNFFLMYVCMYVCVKYNVFIVYYLSLLI